MNDPSSSAIDLLHPSACLCTALRRASRNLSAAYDQALADAGLSNSQFNLLVKLGQCGPVSIKALAAAISIDRTTLSRTLVPLISRGLISERAGNDRRVKWIALTSKGRTALARAEGGWRTIQQAMIDRFGADQAAALLESLAALSGAADAAGSGEPELAGTWQAEIKRPA
ncbi:MAG: winged helix-turn-helix transcriptional regulator [Rhizobiales bacterium]|nr:winged helix-turn-helix transcriptional regulator [Hyphomicrobiales bacterium]